MSKKMLMDATHSEETRVVVMDGECLEELDIETSIKKQIKGNIYLAKVIRVEPSLQAAFVDYGGNRHGFLAFNEIHPDYYQLPVSDKEEIKRQMMEKFEEHKKVLTEKNTNDKKEDSETDAEIEEFRKFRGRFFKQYKIQEVIHHNQILLIQVVKEERGNKGAALTTYLSLAGRYCVLMPNNGKAGGVSRKIVNLKDRNRLKEVVEKLPIPDDMSVIVRTAGKEKTKAEIKRDFDFLMKTWTIIRDTTLESMAPSLIYEEGDIIKRALRDVYTQEIDEILVSGDTAYKNAKDFLKRLIPSHAKKVKLYKSEIPLFQKYKVEDQLEEMNNTIVQLKSGGYLVINQTEALVSVDVNSGRATRERNIEETALKTNLEAAEELARQCRLRDLAGLIVVDFIDMDEQKNNHAIERKMKEATKQDRARIQIGPITQFGLLEFSRQRLRSSLLETNHIVCPYCDGQGILRSVESCALHKLHLLEDAGIKASSRDIVMTLPFDVALYLLNHKRENLAELERKYDLIITVRADSTMLKPTDYRLESFMRKKVENVVEKPQMVFEPKQEENDVKKQNRWKNNKKFKKNKPASPKEETTTTALPLEEPKDAPLAKKTPSQNKQKNSPNPQKGQKDKREENKEKEGQKPLENAEKKDLNEAPKKNPQRRNQKQTPKKNEGNKPETSLEKTQEDKKPLMNEDKKTKEVEKSPEKSSEQNGDKPSEKNNQKSFQKRRRPPFRKRPNKEVKESHDKETFKVVEQASLSSLEKKEGQKPSEEKKISQKPLEEKKPAPAQKKQETPTQQKSKRKGWWQKNES
ncbi:MAG: Rne/Rng family ribonuclease [Alphaproteobacteria bacterium]|nr:Rne/Rng family ribonuclease [Alphaproteobacteria bacterium]